MIKNVAFLGYDFFYSALEKLIEKGCQIKWLFTCECDNKYNFNTRVLRQAHLTGANISLKRITKSDILNLVENGCDLIVSASYPYKIPVVEKMPPAINIHPTLLPEGKGPWPLPCVIMQGLKENGVSIHKIDSSFDTGDILLQKKIPVFRNDNLETLSSRSQILAAELLEHLLDNFNSYWENAIPQSKGNYWAMPSYEDRELKWSSSIWEIEKTARAFGKFDSLAKFDGLEWIVKDLTVWEENHTFEVGKVIHRTDKEVVISAKDGFVCIRFFEPDPDA